MEDVRRAAVAYYENLSVEEKRLARSFFNEMDKNGDGQVSLQEYMDYLKKKNFTVFIQYPSLFQLMDKDDNGNLDFEETVALYYIFCSGRAVLCDCCKSIMLGVYFSCVQCFCPVTSTTTTYDLCCACYGGKKFTHHDDAVFFDNYTLLRVSRSMLQDLSRSIIQEARGEEKGKAFKTLGGMVKLAGTTVNAVNTAVDLADTTANAVDLANTTASIVNAASLAASCSIM